MRLFCTSPLNFSGEFILEYVGEVLNSDEFDKRAEVYSQDKNIHYYFMALRADAIIDATIKGKILLAEILEFTSVMLQVIFQGLLIIPVIQMRKLRNGR